MWQWNDGTMELYHYGVKGMRWGHRKAKVYMEGASKKTFKRDMNRIHSRNGLKIGYDFNQKTGQMEITKVYSSDGKIRGRK